MKTVMTTLVTVVAFLIAVCPALAQYKVYWGDMHGHTGLSDGKGSLDDYFTYARDSAKLDFVVVTDHDFGNGKPTWDMSKENWQLTQDKVEQFTINGKFVAIAGYEWTSQPKYWTPEEQHFTGPVKYYNHKNVYFHPRWTTSSVPETRPTIARNFSLRKYGSTRADSQQSSRFRPEWKGPIRLRSSLLHGDRQFRNFTRYGSIRRENVQLELRKKPAGVPRQGRQDRLPRQQRYP